MHQHFRPAGRHLLAILLAMLVSVFLVSGAIAALKDELLKEVAGEWQMRTLNLEGDQVLLRYRIDATASEDGWVLHIPERPPIKMRVREITADSIVADAEPYESALRDDVMVTTRFVLQRKGSDRWSGVIVGVYEMPEGNTTVALRVEGERVP